MDDDRIATDLWVRAHIRRCSAAAVPIAVVHRGAHYGGMVLLKLNQLNQGCRLLTQTRDMEGKLAWLPALSGALVPEAEADRYIARALSRDRDLWVLEIEHRDGWHPFEGEEL